jgi:nitric oxide reductase NorQ protein
MTSNSFQYLRGSSINGLLRVWDMAGEEKSYYEQGRAGIDRLFFKYSFSNDNNHKDFYFKLFSAGNVRLTDDVGEAHFPPLPNSMTTPQLDSIESPAMTDTPQEYSEESIAQLIHTAHEIRPSTLILSDVKWKYLVRSVLRGKNIMIVGPAGCGKTLAVTTVASAMNRPFFYFNLGATQDPRSALVGNTHFDKQSGTYFADSIFVKAIQTKNAVILLDELSRAHPEAWNILMTVVDETQRYLRIDESPNTPLVRVADGVSFIATANIGMEYTSTRVIDRAMQDRFQILEMDVLTKDQQSNLIKMTHQSINASDAATLSEIYSVILSESRDGSRISTALSTRTVLAAAGLMCDGFTLQEAADVCIYPYYSNDGGIDSERVYVRQIVQRFIPDETLTSSNIFTPDDTAGYNS